MKPFNPSNKDRACLATVAANNGMTAAEIAERVRGSLPALEKADYVAFGTDEKWRATPKGTTYLKKYGA